MGGVQRHGSDGSAVIRLRAAGLILLIAHLVLVAWLTLRPRDVMWVTAANLEPLAGIKADLALGPLEAARRIGEGLLLLAPLGVLLPMAGGRLAASPWASLFRTVMAGALVSLGIELAQTVVPGRVVDVDAVLLNTLGVALAHLAVVPVWRGRLRRRRPGPGAGRGQRPAGGGGRGLGMLRDDVSQGATPRIPRVGIAP
ncbi:VanZ family protein [Streptomyces lavendofoliae]|uniref:VanZ family protein n=1 Tax=Streptomyces lavendofoliae TaxID=67314 RepID=UPI0016768972|nr:VanZ family protein [Streptomyces lavendofoliae]